LNRAQTNHNYDEYSGVKKLKTVKASNNEMDIAKIHNGRIITQVSVATAFNKTLPWC